MRPHWTFDATSAPLNWLAQPFKIDGRAFGPSAKIGFACDERLHSRQFVNHPQAQTYTGAAAYVQGSRLLFGCLSHDGRLQLEFGEVADVAGVTLLVSHDAPSVRGALNLDEAARYLGVNRRTAERFVAEVSIGEARIGQGHYRGIGET